MTSRMAKAGCVGAALLLMALVGCGGAKSGNTEAASAADQAGGTDASGLTAFQMENGVGPITDVVQVGEIDHEKAEAGEKTFTEKCSACHKMAERYVGPALGEVTVRRTPTYVMNMGAGQIRGRNRDDQVSMTGAACDVLGCQPDE